MSLSHLLNSRSVVEQYIDARCKVALILAIMLANLFDCLVLLGEQNERVAFRRCKDAILLSPLAQQGENELRSESFLCVW